MTVFSWSTTAASNATADTSINWREGQAPSAVNDSARAMMAAIAKWRDDMSGNLVTAGTSTAYTLTTNQTFTALTDGISVKCRMSATNGASPTLNVDSLGAKSIATVYGTAVSTGILLSGGVYTFTYDATDDKWIVSGAPSANLIAPAGTALVFYQDSAPTGWTIVTTNTNDRALRVVSGSSAGGGTGGALAGTTAFTSVFTSRTITQANLPNVTLSGTAAAAGAHSHNGGFNAGSNISTGGNVNRGGVDATTSTEPDHTHNVSVSLGGSGTALDFAVKYASVIICTKS